MYIAFLPLVPKQYNPVRFWSNWGMDRRIGGCLGLDVLYLRDTKHFWTLASKGMLAWIPRTLRNGNDGPISEGRECIFN